MIGALVARPRRLALAAIVVGALLVFAPVLAARLPDVRDVVGFTLPSRLLWREAILGARLPEWNPFVQLGVPMLPTPVHGALYPGQLLFLILPPVIAFGVAWLLHAILAGWGAYELARAIGCRDAIACIAGLVATTGGYAVSMWWNGEKVTSGAWVLVFAWRAVVAAKGDALRPRDVALAAASLAMVALAGDPFLWLDAIAIALPVAWAVACEDARPGPAALRVLGRGAVVVAAAALLAAPILIPAWLVRGQTQRAGDLASGAAEAWSMHPARLLELVAPGALGDPSDLARYPGGMFADEPTVQALPWAPSIYAGAACVALAPLAIGSRLGIALGATAAASTLAAMGKFTPVHAALRAIVPPLRWMRYPEKHFFVATIALALLAALGAERVLRGEARARWGAAVLVALAVVALGVAPRDLRPFVIAGILHAIVAGALIVAALVAAKRRDALAWAAVAIVAVDLAVAARHLVAWAPPGTGVEPPPLARAILEHRGVAPPRVYRPRLRHLDAASLPDAAGAPFGIASLPSHDPAKSPWAVALDRALPVEKLAPLYGLHWALLAPSDEAPPDAPWTPHLIGRLPRAWLVGDAEALGDDAALARMQAADFDPWARATLAPGSPIAPSDRRGRCGVTDYAPERIAIGCDAVGDALVVVSEQWAPGWRATIDGAPAPILRADLALRALRVPAGHHLVVMEYATPGLGVGLALGALGWALFAISLRRPKTARREAAPDVSLAS